MNIFKWMDKKKTIEINADRRRLWYLRWETSDDGANQVERPSNRNKVDRFVRGDVSSSSFSLSLSSSLCRG